MQINRSDHLSSNQTGSAGSLPLPLDIALWDYSPECGWAQQFQQAVARSGKLNPKIHRMLHRSPRAGGAKALPPADLLVFTISPENLASGTAAIRNVHQGASHCPIMAVTASQSEETLLGLMEAGASDFLSPPLRPPEVLARLFRCVRGSSMLDLAAKSLNGDLQEIVGQSKCIRSQIEKARCYALRDAAVVITGETGTGKELFARMIHNLGRRSSRPFVAINCAALPAELVENELFGHEPGAFTGASHRHQGLIEQAQGGTLFLDEVDSLPMAAQAKLLRFLQDHEYQPLGASRSRGADVRIISASNADLAAATRAGRFRQDLYFRLNVLGLALHPLREWREDIPLLVNHFLTHHCRQRHQGTRKVSAAAMEKLVAHDWPGNVRELENVIERAISLSTSAVIGIPDVDLATTPCGALKDQEGAKRVGDPGRAPAVCSDAIKHRGGRPRKDCADELLAVLGDQKLACREWFKQVQRVGAHISIRTFHRRRHDLESAGEIVCVDEGRYQKPLAKNH